MFDLNRRGRVQPESAGERADIIQALLKVKDAINKALDELSPVTVYDDEPPF